MIHYATREQIRNWHKHISFLLFAYKLAPNATTDITLFPILYGRHQNCPLSILKPLWINEISLPFDQLSSVTNDFTMAAIISCSKAANISRIKIEALDAHNFNQRINLSYEFLTVITKCMPDGQHQLRCSKKITYS